MNVESADITVMNNKGGYVRTPPVLSPAYVPTAILAPDRTAGVRLESSKVCHMEDGVY